MTSIIAYLSTGFPSSVLIRADKRLLLFPDPIAAFISDTPVKFSVWFYCHGKLLQRSFNALIWTSFSSTSSSHSSHTAVDVGL